MNRARGPSIRLRRLGTGFTLLELIVVLAVFSIFAVMAYGGLAGVLSARERVLESFERTAALQKAYLRLRNDFQQLRARPVRDGYGQAQPALQVMPDGAVEFTRSGWRNPAGLPRPALERVAYRLDGDNRLVRASWRVLDRAQDSPVSEVIVLEKVDDLQWRFLDGAEWRDRFPILAASGQTPLDVAPRAVELLLTLQDLGEVRLLFSATNEVQR